MSDTPSSAIELNLASATLESFASYVGQTFEAIFTDGRLPLKLAAASPLGGSRVPGGRAPFSLLFHGRPNLRLPQRIYRLENTALGTLEVFLVQVNGTPDASAFEAVFT